MKQLRFILLLTAFFALGATLNSCGGNDSSSADTEKQGKEYTSAYICPMHCAGSGSEEPGKCPVCNMDYVANEDHKSDGHDHDHEGHSH